MGVIAYRKLLREQVEAVMDGGEPLPQAPGGTLSRDGATDEEIRQAQDNLETISLS